MFSTIRNAFKNPELRKRLIFTIFILVVFRFGSSILVPFVNAGALKSLVGDGNNFFALLNTFSGGAFANATIFALSIQPYITATIIVQLLTVAIPPLERLAKEGETGRKKLNKVSRWVTLAMALVQSYAYYVLVRNQGGIESHSSLPQGLSSWPLPQALAPWYGWGIKSPKRGSGTGFP